YFKLLEKDELIKYNDEIELIFIELPKFKKEEDELTSITDKWIYFIKNAGGLEYTPKRLTENAEIKKAFEIANTANMSKEELDVQWKQHDFILCQKGSLELALKQGIKQGRKEKAIEMAKSLLTLKIDIEKIAKVTGLSANEVEKIK
ncbi:MAG: Rpn family recombination-promoting nuclease/putative transposase, partial [bacterium]|nr:Rpn family recombination-promoting nuclease/putative transposase [bacterium]